MHEYLDKFVSPNKYDFTTQNLQGEEIRLKLNSQQ